MTKVVGRLGELTLRTLPPSVRGSTRRGSGSWRSSRGQAMVEFALIAPLFFLLFFGIVEYSLINASIGAYNFAASDGARFGAILGKGAVSISSTQTVPTDQYLVNNIVLPHVSGVVVAQMTRVEIYNSDESGVCVTTSGACQEDVWQRVSGAWASTSDTWPSSARNDQLANADYLGVKISYTYTYLTAFFAVSSPTIDLTATSIQRIEPQQYGAIPSHAASAQAMVGALWSPLALMNIFDSMRLARWRHDGLSTLTGGRV